MKKQKIGLKELVMLLILYCIQRLKCFFLRVIGMQHFAIIFKVVKQATPCLTYSIPIPLDTGLEAWSRSNEKKLKKWQGGDDIKNDTSSCALFQRILLKSGDECPVIHRGK
jgi:hypothetical protein